MSEQASQTRRILHIVDAQVSVTHLVPSAVRAAGGVVEHCSDVYEGLSRLAREVGYVSQGRWEEAIPVLEEMYEHRDAGLRVLRTMHKSFGAWDELMARPRYRALMEKINMDDASIAELERTIEF